MIACLKGELFYKSPEKLIVDVGGVGYEVLLPPNSIGRLPEIGEEVFLYIHTSVREDSLTLYGFVEIAEKEMFLLLISVSGVGPKLALNIVSNISPADLGRAILAEDLQRLTRLPGIGKKTAERLFLELKDKVPFLPANLEVAQAPVESRELDDQRGRDVVSALVNLGYPAPKARQAVERLRRQTPEDTFQSMNLEEMLRQTLRSLA